MIRYRGERQGSTIFTFPYDQNIWEKWEIRRNEHEGH